MAQIALTIKGDTPLVVKNDRLADPLNEWTQRLSDLTSKRKKTVDDHQMVGRVEWEGSLYWAEDTGPFIPAENMLKCLIEGARLRKLGKEVERSIVILDESLPILYDGPRDPDAMFADGFQYRKSVGVGQKRVMRNRPIFRDWALTATLLMDDSRLDLRELKAIVADAGQYVGLAERRPLFGRFTGVVQ